MSTVKENDVKSSNQPVVENPTKAAFDALVSGKDPNEAVYGTSESEADLSSNNDPVLSEVSPLEELEQNLSEGLAPSDSTDTIASSSESQPQEAQPPESLLDSVTDADPQPASEASSVDYITVRGKDGRKQKLKIDYSDKEAIKKFAAKAAGRTNKISETVAIQIGKSDFFNT